jgi:hypothetical protein
MFVRNRPIDRSDLFGLLAPDNYAAWGEGVPDGFIGPTAPLRGNCWRYACNDPAKPGEPWKTHPADCRVNDKEARYTCEDIMNGARKKGAIDPGTEGECPYGWYKIKGVVVEKNPRILDDGRPYYDYHWFRQNDDDSWSDKRGATPVNPNTPNPLKDPKYDKDCGDLCLPKRGIDTD